MKKKLYFILMTFSVAISMHAQFYVYDDWNVGFSNITEFPYAQLTIGEASSAGYSSYKFCQFISHDGSFASQSNYRIGLQSPVYASNPSNSGKAIGIAGIAGNSSTGRNYGVIGGLRGSQNGAGVFGTIFNVVGVGVNGRYAGFFNGDAYMSSTLTVPTISILSDPQLREHVSPLKKSKDISVLTKVMNMNAVSYRQKKADNSESAKKHYGLLAQELQNVYPELVLKGQDGRMLVNYLEIVPVLVTAIQELKIELDDAREDRNAKKERSYSSLVTDKDCFLSQSNTSMFSKVIRIHYKLPANVQNASIDILDMTGYLEKQVPVSSKKQSIDVNGDDLSAGMYMCSLIVNGQVKDTKRIILSK